MVREETCILGADINKNRGVLSSLTSLRFFAALAVLIHHTAGICENLYLFNLVGQVGWLGVSFFFVLSGFVLMWSFDRKISPSVYILRRLTRIYPLHIVCLLVSLCFFLLTGFPIGGYIGTIPGTIANFLLIQDWVPGHPNIRQAWNGVSWTLSCEFFFYILAPFVFQILIRSAIFKQILIAVITWSIFVFIVIISKSKGWNSVIDFFQMYPVPRAYEFFLGAIGAQWIKAGGKSGSKMLSIIVMVVPNFVYCTFIPEASRCSELMILIFIPGVFLFIVAIAGKDNDGIKCWMQRALLVHLGDASFSLYMIHALLLGVFSIIINLYITKEFFSSIYLETLFVVLFVFVSVTLSLLVHRYLEFPTRQILLRFLKQKEPIVISTVTQE